jgi:hypothetical protein
MKTLLLSLLALAACSLASAQQTIEFRSPTEIIIDGAPAGKVVDVIQNYPDRAAAIQAALEAYCEELARTGAANAVTMGFGAVTQVTPLQMRRALNATELRAAVEAAVAAADQDARDAWQYASVIRRDDPILAAMAAALGKTPEEIDELFALAAQL